MRSMKNASDFIEIKKLEEKDVESSFHTEVSKVKKKPTRYFTKRNLPKKYKNIWYKKTDTESGDGLREVIAQELFRLFIPNQPKTRLIDQYDVTKETVVSKEVPGYRCWEKMDKAELNKKIKDGTYYGFGEVLVIAMLVNETDLKEGNLCLNDKNQVIKLDGDCCFAKLAGWDRYKDKTHDITADDIRELPYIVNYFSNHWLDLVVDSQKSATQIIIDKEMVTLKSFRAEVNRAILKTLILPDRLFLDFINHHTTTRTETYQFYNEVRERRDQMKRAALSNESFCEYMQTDESNKDLVSYLGYLDAFKMTGKTTLNMSLHEKEIFAQYDRLAVAAKANIDNGAFEYRPVGVSEEQEYFEKEVKAEPKRKLWHSPMTLFGGAVGDIDMVEDNMMVRNRWR